MRGRHAREPVRQVAARAVDGRHLEVLRVGVVHLAVARHDLALHLREVEQRLVREPVHPVDQRAEVALDDEVGAVLLERLHRRGRAGRHAALDQLAHAPVGDVRVLLGARQRELALDDLLGEDEPGVVVTGARDVLERAERVEAGEERHGEALPGGVEPQRGGAGEDADPVHRPDRVPVLDALGVVPHPVRVDHVRAGALGDLDHAPVHMRGHARDHPLGRLAEPLGPVAAHQRVVAADAARAHDHDRRAQLEVAALVAVARLAACARVGGQQLPGDAVNGAVRAGERVDPVAEAELHEAAPRRVAHAPYERLDHTRTRAPGDVEARHRVPVPDGAVAAALGPADHR